MKKQKLIILVTVLVLIASTAGVLGFYRGRQKLGQPGLKTRPIPGAANLQIDLPEQVLNYTSEIVPEDQGSLDTLPKDTSYARRRYHSADGVSLDLWAVLMGADRTSLHKPQICMTTEGFTIDKTEIIELPLQQPRPYSLPVIKLSVSKPAPGMPDGVVRGTFLYWFVADGATSADPSALARLWLSTKNLVATGEMQRWAYVACYSLYTGTDEAPCLERLKQFLAEAVPQFQTAGSGAAVR